jgi:hypothetical protein
VANCGSLDTTPAFLGANGIQTANEVSAGVFLDYYNVPSMPRMTTSNIKDGTAQTLLFSENIQTGYWMGSSTAAWNGGSTIWYNLIGMFWTANPGSTTGLAVNVGRTDLGIVPGLLASAGVYYPQNATDYTHARPSSNHPGMVVVTYCDGHQADLTDDVAYPVYQELMAPDDATAWGLIGTTPPTLPLP